MKRYGDNVSHEDIVDEPTGNKAGQDRAFFGGCGATFGSIPTRANRPTAVNAPKSHWLGDLLSFLGGKREKQQENH